MTTASKGGVVAGGVVLVVGLGVGSTFLKDSNGLITLEGKNGYGKDQASEKFGARYAPFLLSHLGNDNQGKWSERVKELSESTIIISGYLGGSYVSAKVWKNDKGSKDEEKRLSDAIRQLKTSCGRSYDEKVFTKPDDDEKGWKHVWTYCSVDGKEHWEETPTDETSN